MPRLAAKKAAGIREPCYPEDTTHLMDIRVRLWTVILEGWVAFGAFIRFRLTIFSTCSIERDSFFFFRSTRAGSVGFNGAVCKEQSDEVVGFATTWVESGIEASTASIFWVCGVLWGTLCSPSTGVAGSSVNWICCWDAASSSQLLLLSRACELHLVLNKETYIHEI